MQDNYSIAILTPTYNRATLLPRLYESLVNQTNKNFVWYVVDDGSSDNTKEVVEGFISEEKIKIKYFYKTNGGKHTALNVGIQQISEDLLIIVDSDDYLTTDAVQTVINDAFRIKGEQFCGLGYLKQSTNGNVVGKKYTEDYVEDTFINQRYNKKTYGDKCEVFKTAILKQFPFPEFEGEKFLSEATVWCKMSGPYKMVFINKAIYVCEYQEGGLSDGVRKRLFTNPKGAVKCYNTLCGKGFNLINRAKFVLLYIVHCLADNRKYQKIIKDCSSNFLCFIMYPLGYLIYIKRSRCFASR